MKCLKCNAEFEPKRADAKFCSDKCRKASKRDITADITADNVSEIIKADVRDKVTDKLTKVKDLTHDQQRRFLFLLGCCKITTEKAIRTIIENDLEYAQV